MSIGLEILPLIISIAAFLSLRSVTGWFEKAEKAKLAIDLKAEKLQLQFTKWISLAMEEDYQRHLGPVKEKDFPTRQDFLTHQRDKVAEELTSKIWEDTIKYMNLINTHNFWVHWEKRGYSTCVIGSFVDMIIFGVLLIVILVRPVPIIVNSLYVWLTTLIIFIPIVWALSCWLIASNFEKKFVSLRDG